MHLFYPSFKYNTMALLLETNTAQRAHEPSTELLNRESRTHLSQLSVRLNFRDRLGSGAARQAEALGRPG